MCCLEPGTSFQTITPPFGRCLNVSGQASKVRTAHKPTPPALLLCLHILSRAPCPTSQVSTLSTLSVLISAPRCHPQGLLAADRSRRRACVCSCMRGWRCVWRCVFVCTGPRGSMLTPLSSHHPSHPPKLTPSPPDAYLTIPHVGRRPRGRERAAAAPFSGVDFGLRPLAAVAARDGRGGLGSRWGAEGGLVGGGRSPRLRRRVPAAGTGWVAPREPETPPPSHGHVHARAHARTVTFKYNCVTVRRPRVYIKLSIAISIVLDSGVSLGCSPPPRKGVRGRVHRPPSVPSSTGTPKSRT